MLLERNLGKSKLLTLLTARVKNGIWRKKKERMKKKSLVRAAGGIPRAECSASGQDTKASGLLFTKTGRD